MRQHEHHLPRARSLAHQRRFRRGSDRCGRHDGRRECAVPVLSRAAGTHRLLRRHHDDHLRRLRRRPAPDLAGGRIAVGPHRPTAGHQRRADDPGREHDHLLAGRQRRDPDWCPHRPRDRGWPVAVGADRSGRRPRTTQSARFRGRVEHRDPDCRTCPRCSRRGGRSGSGGRSRLRHCLRGGRSVVRGARTPDLAGAGDLASCRGSPHLVATAGGSSCARTSGVSARAARAHRELGDRGPLPFARRSAGGR